MAIAPGTRFGAYEVLSGLGAGGMGEIYLARDARLGRDVAIKVLPESFALDADRVARFAREAKTLAALNHPNIAAIYGIEEHASGTRAATALVMELVDGEDLAQILERGPMPLAGALSIARQIADALDAAHERGIIHRDLKPANIRLRSDGVVKVLDFGLAKTLDRGGDAGGSVTVTSPAVSAVGTIVGTAAYMSPEQATGRAVDKRADIWAFGCVLYEMLTGRRAFAGATVTETLAAVLEHDVDWTRLPVATPANVRTVLRRTLEKDPRRRLHDIADVRIELDDQAAPADANPNGRRSAAWWVAAVALVALAAAFAAWQLKPAAAPPSAQIARLIVAPEAPVSPDTEGAIALSPDGTRLAYVVASSGGRLLYLRSLDQYEGRPIPGTEGADDPAFSPDGQWLAFVTDHEIKKVAVAGGAPQSLCQLAGVRGLTWESPQTILFNGGRAAGLFRVSAAGGTPAPVTMLGTGDLEHDFPQVLPGGKSVVFTLSQAGAIGSPRIVAQSLETGARREIAAGAGGRYLPTGHLVYVRGGSLFAVPFDVARLEPTGTPTVVLQDVRQTQFGTPQIDYSATGSIAYVPTAAREHQDTLVWLDDKGIEDPTAVSAQDVWMPRLAPDLRRVLIVSQEDVWLSDVTLGRRSRLTVEGASAFPVWSPTGTRFAYRSNRSGRFEMYVKSVDGATAEQRIPTEHNANIPLSWSPDGRWLAAVAVSDATHNDIWVYAMDGRSPARPFLQTEFREGAPTFSPDGGWIAYASDQSGRSEIYMRPFPGQGEELMISTGGGSEPLWARKSGRLFYRQGDAMMAVDVTTSPSVTVGPPRRLFERRYNRSNGYWPDFDVTADGRRLLMVKGIAPEASTRINVVLNWFEELKRLAPGR